MPAVASSRQPRDGATRQAGRHTVCSTQQDPIGIAGGANVYGFAGGDPVNFADPFGLCTGKSGEKAADDKCREITSQEGEKVYDAAVASGSWTYHKLPISGKDVCNKKGDCTDYVESAMRGAGLPAQASPTRTSEFAASDDNYPVAESAARKGDVIVQGGHAGLVRERGADGVIRGIQNGNSGTAVIRWGKGVKGLDNVSPIVYRRRVPQ